LGLVLFGEKNVFCLDFSLKFFGKRGGEREGRKRRRGGSGRWWVARERWREVFNFSIFFVY